MSEPVTIALITALPQILTACAAVLSALLAGLALKQGRHTYRQINSRMDEMLNLKGKEGEGIGQARERDRGERMRPPTEPPERPKI